MQRKNGRHYATAAVINSKSIEVFCVTFLHRRGPADVAAIILFLFFPVRRSYIAGFCCDKPEAIKYLQYNNTCIVLLYPIAFSSELLQGCCVGVLGLFFPLRLYAGSPVSLTDCPSWTFSPSVKPSHCNPSCLFPTPESCTELLIAVWCGHWRHKKSYILWLLGVCGRHFYGSRVVSVLFASDSCLTSPTCFCQGNLQMWLTVSR